MLNLLCSIYLVSKSQNLNLIMRQWGMGSRSSWNWVFSPQIPWSKTPEFQILVFLYYFPSFSQQTIQRQKIKNKNKRTNKQTTKKPIYQEATKSSLDPDCSPFLPHNSKTFGWSSNHCSYSSCESISTHWWRVRSLWVSSMPSFESPPWRPHFPWWAPPQPPFLALTPNLLLHTKNEERKKIMTPSSLWAKIFIFQFLKHKTKQKIRCRKSFVFFCFAEFSWQPNRC